MTLFDLRNGGKYLITFLEIRCNITDFIEIIKIKQKIILNIIPSNKFFLSVQMIIFTSANFTISKRAFSFNNKPNKNR